MRLLLIDDDLDDRELFGYATEQSKLDIVLQTASSAKDAMQKLAPDTGYTPDIIFLDLNMPLINGKECLAELKKAAHTHQIPVYIYTTSSHIKDKQETIALGAAGFITKPYSIEELTDSIKQVLSAYEYC